MSGPTEAPVRDLVDGVDVDAVAQATRGCPGVEDLHGGFPGEVATYLPGRRLAGVRVGSRTVEVQVRAAWNTPLRQIAAGIRSAVAPLAGGRAVDVTIADLGDPPGTGETRTAREPGASGQPEAKLGWPAMTGEAHRDPPAAHGLAASGGSAEDQPERLEWSAPPGQPARATPPKAEGKSRS
jgi:hypothetical protein